MHKDTKPIWAGLIIGLLALPAFATPPQGTMPPEVQSAIDASTFMVAPAVDADAVLTAQGAGQTFPVGTEWAGLYDSVKPPLHSQPPIPQVVRLDQGQSSRFFHRVHVPPPLEGARTWFGRELGTPGNQLAVTTYDGAFAGHLSIDGNAWSLEGDATGVVATREAEAHEHDCGLVDEDIQQMVSALTLAIPTPPLTGPYAGLTAVIDVMYVWGPAVRAMAGGDAQAQALFINALLTTNAALQNSNIGAAFRIVDMQFINWDPDPTQNHCNARAELRDIDGIADFVPGMRDAVGADLVLSAATPLPGVDFGCAEWVPAPIDTLAYANIARASLQNSLRHELGHLLGLCHGQVNGTCANAIENNFNYPFGFVFTPPGFTQPVSTIMAGGNRINFYSNPNVQFPAVNGAATGTNALVGGRAANSARRINETMVAVSQYRDTSNLPNRATLTAPLMGDQLVNATTTFSWTDTATQYFLEVYEPGGNIWFSQNMGTALTAQVPVPTDGRLMAARLWSDLGGAQWAWEDYRFNHALQPIGCDADDADLVPDPTFAAADCIDAGSVCTYNSATTTYTCRLNRGSGSAEGLLQSASRPASGSRIYDIVTFGRTSTGANFCCLLADPANQLQSMLVVGTPQDDEMAAFADTGAMPMTTYNAGTLDFEARGKGGDDLVVGSNSGTFDYTETLKGNRDADLVAGFGGNDRLYAGMGDDDIIDGGEGFDVVIGGDGFDILHGGPGWDVLCTEDGDDKLVGSWVFGAFDLNRLYVSSGFTGTFHPDTTGNAAISRCGHDDDYETGATSFPSNACTEFTLVDVPSACVGDVPQ